MKVIYQSFLALAVVFAITTARASAQDAAIFASPSIDGMKEILDDIEFANQINGFNNQAKPSSDVESPWVMDTTNNAQDGLSQVQNLFAPRPGEQADETQAALQ